MCNLLPHNQKAVDAVLKSFADGNHKVAIVHATGTGKSYCISAVAENYSHVLVIAPNDYVLDETRKVCHQGCDFRTYSSTIHHSTENNRYDLIVLDEFHRSGARLWGKGVRDILTQNPNAYVFGTSATPVRNLDKNRNMADEMFDSNVVSELSLKNAIDSEILPNPIYVRSIYSFDYYKDKIKRIKRKSLEKASLIKKLTVIKNNWENAGGVSAIIRKYCDHDMKRMIVFSRSIKKVEEVRDLLDKWFRRAGFYNVRFYIIHSKQQNFNRQMKMFQEDEEGVLKIAISVNMLNEGVHIPHVDGIVMLRSSMSQIIISQQIGRCLSAGNREKHPVVLDLVNNMELMNYEGKEQLEKESTQYSSYNNVHKNSVNQEPFPFQVIDECKDIREALKVVNSLIVGSHTKEECMESAKLYKTLKEWQTANPNLYDYARKHGWYKECTAHMEKQNQSYTKEECMESAKLYKTRNEWKKSARKFYDFAHNHGWAEECTAHMKWQHQSYTKEECMESAKLYKTRNEWKKSAPNLYNYARQYEWIDECTAHMEKQNQSYTKEECMESAKLYKTRKEWQTANHSMYSYAYHHGWLEECTAHMEYQHQSHTKEECIESTKLYNTLKEWKIANPNLYAYAYRYGWLEECTAHMEKQNQSHTKEECIESAKLYKTRNEWKKFARKFYDYAHNHGWLEECTAHMEWKCKPRTKEECIESAKLYKSPTDWLKGNRKFYNYARTHGWLDECYSFFKKL